MGGRGGSSHGGGGRFKMPKFTTGSEKQQAWAGRILSGFDDAFSANIKTAESNQSIYNQRGVKSIAEQYARDAVALTKARSNYRASAVKQTDAVRIINNRDRLASGVEKMIRQAVSDTRNYNINVKPSR